MVLTKMTKSRRRPQKPPAPRHGRPGGIEWGRLPLPSPAPTRHAKATERIAAATEQQANGLAETSTAVERWRRSPAAAKKRPARHRSNWAVRNIVASLSSAREHGART